MSSWGEYSRKKMMWEGRKKADAELYGKKHANGLLGDNFDEVYAHQQQRLHDEHLGVHKTEGKTKVKFEGQGTDNKVTPSQYPNNVNNVNKMKKIDIHCHATNRPLKDVVPASATIEAITTEMQKHDIERTAVLASYFPHKQSGISNYRMLHWIKDKPEFTLFGSLDFNHYFYQGFNELEELAGEKSIKGIKIYSCYQEVDLRSPQVKSVMDLAAEHSLVMMFHGGESYQCQRHFQREAVANLVTPSDLEYVVKNWPTVPVIVSHLAGSYLSQLINLVNSHTNVYSDMSGLLDSKFEKKAIPECTESIKQYLGECGPSRLLFGTDFPVQTHEHSIFMVEEAMKNYGIADKEKVYYQNAKRLLEVKK